MQRLYAHPHGLFGVLAIAVGACGSSMCGSSPAPRGHRVIAPVPSAVTQPSPISAPEAKAPPRDSPSQVAPEPVPEAARTQCTTPIAAWPALCREDLPPALASFAEPVLPKARGTVKVLRKKEDQHGIPNGTRVTVVSDWKDQLFMSGSDLDYVIADGVTVDSVIIDTCKRCRLRGGGPNSRVKYLFVQKSADVTIDSVMIKADIKFNQLAVDLHNNQRLALISSLFHSPYSAAMFAFAIESFLIAGSSWGSSDAQGVNDWGSRFASTNDLVIVDSQVEARGLQPVLRRSGESARHFYLRTTTINLYSGEATLDLGGENLDAYDTMYQRSPRYYVSNLSKRYDTLRFGGSPNDDGRRGVYEVTDAVWITPEGKGEGAVHVTDATLARTEEDPWRYRLGKPTYNATLKGGYEQRHPGWPVRVSRTLGKPLGVSNPYEL